MIIKLVYHTIMYRVLDTLWYWWHCRMRSWYDGAQHRSETRPFWHLCCNGDSGGWRTALCHRLEDFSTGWRYHQNEMDKIHHAKCQYCEKEDR